MIDLIAERDGYTRAAAERRWDLTAWVAFNNPAAGAQPTYYVAVYKGRIVAHLGRMPSDFSVQGKDARGYFIHDLFVHPDTRRMGLGLFISMELYERANSDSDSFCCLVWTTPLNLELQRRNGYAETYTPGLVRPLNANDFVKNPLARAALNPPGALLSRASALILGGRSNGIKTSIVRRCDGRFDRLWEETRPKLNICTSRSAAVLNWKYIDRPFARETILAAEKEGALSGFAVLTTSPEKREEKVGIIVDLLTSPDDSETLKALCSSAVRFFHSQGLGSARAVLSHPAFSMAFKRQMFLSTKNSRRVVMFGNLDRSPVPREILTDTGHWNLTRGESDGYMLST